MEEIKEIIFENQNKNEPDDLMEQFLSSGYLEDNTLMMDRFLDIGRTIDLEKLELAIKLIIEYLEKSVKFENAIYINLGNMDKYVEARGIQDNLDRILEESSFILGFCSSVAEEYELNKKVIIQFKGKEI